MTLASTLLLALAIVSAVSAETFQVFWDFIPNPPLDVKVGDTLAFTWLSGLHDIYIHPTLDCDETGAIALYAPATEGGSSAYTFLAEDASPDGNDMFFACDIVGHCDGGNMNLAVKVFPADAAPTAAPVDAVDLSCDYPSDSCPFQFDGKCNKLLEGCENGDCFDCDECRKFDYDCNACTNSGCYWCPGDATCYNSPFYPFDNVFRSCGNGAGFEYTSDSCTEPENFFR
jgi:hypothetical protein